MCQKVFLEYLLTKACESLRKYRIYRNKNSGCTRWIMEQRKSLRKQTEMRRVLATAGKAAKKNNSVAAAAAATATIVVAPCPLPLLSFHDSLHPASI